MGVEQRMKAQAVLMLRIAECFPEVDPAWRMDLAAAIENLIDAKLDEMIQPVRNG